MTTIAFAGDWHGNQPFARERILNVADRGVSTVLHVGDFGIWPGRTGKRFLMGVESSCARYGVHILVTPGNHEDHGRLEQRWDNQRAQSDGAPLQPIALTEHITVLPRGYRWQIDGRSFVSLGGAPSVDKHLRSQGTDWWVEEQITEDDVERVAAGGYADVMVTHDSPDVPYAVPQVAQIIATNPQGWPDDSLRYAAVGRARMHQAFEAVAPRLFVHGHYHVRGEATVRVPDADHDTHVWALASDQERVGNLRYLDLATLDEPDWASR
ncbi:metallophosphoesterase [Nocardioides sp. KR10-350]|uniref:metallophosphoesterase family protein n=1 Tax=Nocardioides cheoyonin TaxID=3156615 RepID=UPI0032B5F817